MLITDFLVGRDEKSRFVALIVQDVLPTECDAGRCHLVRKVNRQDLVQEFVSDGVATDWLMFPDLPQDVVEILESGGTIQVVDTAEVSISCTIEPESSLMAQYRKGAM